MSPALHSLPRLPDVAFLPVLERALVKVSRAEFLLASLATVVARPFFTIAYGVDVDGALEPTRSHSVHPSLPPSQCRPVRLMSLCQLALRPSRGYGSSRRTSGYCV